MGSYPQRGFSLFEMLSSRQDGLLQDKVPLLPGKLELLRLQFPLTTDSSPTTSSMFPSCDFILFYLPISLIVPEELLCAPCPCFFKSHSLSQMIPQKSKKRFLHFWFLETPTAGIGLGNGGETTSNCPIWPLSIGGFPLSNDLTHCLQPIPGRKDETRADCCVMTCFFSTLPRSSCSRPKNVKKWLGEFHIGEPLFQKSSSARQDLTSGWLWSL